MHFSRSITLLALGAIAAAKYLPPHCDRICPSSHHGKRICDGPNFIMECQHRDRRPPGGCYKTILLCLETLCKDDDGEQARCTNWNATSAGES
ncbi:hypothetical protein HBH98_057610 [Parastagonospora nodorum]|nr:hypothetical protein HBI09_051570 [Parastagonospora nodorum]KAH4055493.1 hypothetical protein HBH49_059970 [Parastagonospora nodorum]KAH4071918.1 hypothetical protein HBH50_070350 [Parastagonospora nodorum]KAH4094802.1 hypothetical protein HBH48_058610 [Parastagonospora nodorum]KAH4102027.1 hypothetical protein HBH46_131220 [Parastagonospora nodorum]